MVDVLVIRLTCCLCAPLKFENELLELESRGLSITLRTGRTRAREQIRSHCSIVCVHITQLCSHPITL